MITCADLPKILSMHEQNLSRLIHSKRAYQKEDQHIVDVFKDSKLTPEHQLEELIGYFWRAHKHYSAQSATLAYYPGHPSIYGARNDAVEGITRLMPLWAAYLDSPHANPECSEDMARHIKKALVNGTDPQHKFYWGDVCDRSTLICEGADVALALWLVRDTLWPSLNSQQQQQILTWLKQIPNKETADNNWLLFSIIVSQVVASLDASYQCDTDNKYSRIKSFYIGNGCFRDGPKGHIDLYNAWCFHYLLYWLDQISPNFDPNFIQQSNAEFSDWYQHLFTTDGVVLFGRSLCYRMAMPAPILLASDLNPDKIAAGQALNTLISCWRFFTTRGGLKAGRPTQGIFEDNITWLDPYSGPASTFWSVRSLVSYYHLTSKPNWLSVKISPLPSETQSSTKVLGQAGMTIRTDSSAKLSSVEFHQHHNSFSPLQLKTPSLKDQLKSYILGSPHRPNNNLLNENIRRFDSSLKYYR